MNFSFFTMFLKNRNIISKIKRSKVTDYAALMITVPLAKGQITSRTRLSLSEKFETLPKYTSPQLHNTVPPVRLQAETSRSHVTHYTIEPLACS